jgi:hypothetical protein
MVGTALPPPKATGDRWLAWAGGIIAVGLGFVSAVWEAFLTPLAVQWTSAGHAHFVRVPLALVCAVAGNTALTWFTRAVTGRILTVLAPFTGWTAAMLIASTRTAEGDLVLTANNWVSYTTMFVGALTFAVVAYWFVMRSLRRPG